MPRSRMLPADRDAGSARLPAGSTGSRSSTSEVPRAGGADAPGSSPEAAGGREDEPRSAAPIPETAAVPDPFEDADALGELEHEICTLDAHIQAATHRLLVLLADFDRRRGWELGGHRSCAHWLHAATGASPVTAREKVRVARALEGLPKISGAMARGTLHYSKVRALTRVATPACEEELLELARTMTTAALEKELRAWRPGSRVDEAERERRRYRLRRLAVYPDGDGTYRVTGRLMPEEGALLMRAIEAAGDALFRAGAREETTPKQRRADALGLLAERALAAGFGDVGGGTARGNEMPPTGSAETTAGGAQSDLEEERGVGGGGRGEDSDAAIQPEEGRAGEETNATESAEISAGPAEVDVEPADPHPEADAEAAIDRSENDSAESSRSSGADMATDRGPDDSRESSGSCRAGSPPAPISGTRAERYQVMLLVEPAALRSGQDGEESGGCCAGASHLEDGTRLSAEASRRLCCDASVVRVLRDREGSVLDVGRRSRTIPPALRRALEIRDGGCRFPGCGLRFTDGHHITHWADGGETRLENLILLCAFHHRKVHEGGWSVRLAGRGRDRVPLFIDPRGGFHAEAGRCGPSGIRAEADGDGIGGGSGRAYDHDTRAERPDARTERPADPGIPRGVRLVPRRPPPLADQPVEALLAGSRARGLEPDGWSLRSRCERPADVPWTVRARAREALDEAHFGG